MKNHIFIGVWHPSVVLTYCGALFSVIGICMLAEAPTVSVVFLLCAALCDMFDGTVANNFKRTDEEKQFGVQIDSLADTCSFVVFPALMLVHMCEGSVPAYVVAALYTVAGLARLGWFNIKTEESPGVFIGLPVTSSALFVPVLYMMLSSLNVSGAVNSAIWCAGYVLLAVLFISNFELQKPKLVSRLLLLAAGVIIGVVLLYAR